MNNLDARYQGLLEDILHWGVKKTDRTGTGTISVFGRQIRHKMSEGFPLLTTKKMAFKTMTTELLWFLRGDTNIKFLVDNGCHIWDGDAFKNFMDKSVGDPDLIWNQDQFIDKIKTDDDFAKKWGELGPIYGKQWRDWNGKNEVVLTDDRDENGYLMFQKTHIKGIDQIANLISELKTNPDSRRLMVNAWNCSYLGEMVLPPCHYGFQVYTRELSVKERKDLYDKSKYTKDIFPTDENGWNQLFDGCNIPTRSISLMWNQRSVDTGLGLSFNIASYALLLMMIAKQVNMIPEELIGNLGDVHLYLNHIEPIKEQLTRKPYELPTVKISDRVVNDISEYTLDDIILENYQSHPAIKMPLSN